MLSGGLQDKSKKDYSHYNRSKNGQDDYQFMTANEVRIGELKS
jgi:hypothetical protein